MERRDPELKRLSEIDPQMAVAWSDWLVRTLRRDDANSMAAGKAELRARQP
jgi:hypothetical protein